MAGLYIHIPFCHHKCAYCDFHFSVNQRILKKVLLAITKEIKERRNEVAATKMQSIYWGGGTPSLLDMKDIEHVLNQLSLYYFWDKTTEITIECNPEDLNENYLTGLKQLGFNRISLGVQSFNDKVLKWMGRKHTSDQSFSALRFLQKAGFQNYSVDLIFGIPFYASNRLIQDLLHFVQLFAPPHISVYQLTIESKTKLNYLVKTKQIVPSGDKKIIKEFLSIQEALQKHGYLHYEVSNYAQPGFISKHNSSYWLQKPYIGIGPSAHSYNGNERRWNIANNYVYSNNVLSEKQYYEKEVLSTIQKYNEYVLTRLRTSFGCSLSEIEKLFGETFKNHFLKIYEMQKKYFETDKQGCIFTLNKQKGFLMVDKITQAFFIV